MGHFVQLTDYGIPGNITAYANSSFLFLYVLVSNTSLRETVATLLFGTSIPTADFPGIGSSIRISWAANGKAISSCKFNILLTFTPASGKTSYFVTAGPTCAFVIFACTPNDLNVASNNCTVLVICDFSLCCDWVTGSFNN